MANDLNPYAAPKVDVNAEAGSAGLQGTFWRSGALLFARDGAILPARCVKCNANLDQPVKKHRFYWHHQALFLLVLLNVFIYLVVALIVRRRADVTYGLCQVHRNKRTRGILLGLGGVLLFIVLFGFSVTANQPLLVLVGLLGFIASLVVSIVLGRNLMPTRIDRSCAQLKGCGEAFLAALPPR